MGVIILKASGLLHEAQLCQAQFVEGKIGWEQYHAGETVEEEDEVCISKCILWLFSLCLMCLMSFHARCCQSWKTNPGESSLAEFGYHCRGGCDKCNTHGHLDQGRPSLKLWHLMFCHWSISWFVSHVSLFQHSNLSWHKSYVCFVNHEAHLEMFAYMFLASKQAIKHLMERYTSSSDTKPFGEFSHAIILTPHVLLNQITYCQTSFSQIQLIPIGPRYG